MRNFACPRCRQLVFFESTSCATCGLDLGFAPADMSIVAAEGWAACANAARAGCNWLVPTDSARSLCASCRLTRTRPNDLDLDGDPETSEAFVAAEAAKRRLIFQLIDMGLLESERTGDLAFDLLLSKTTQVTIGHADGVVTIDLAESDNAHREQIRREMGEPYRTMLGHLRHEVGHYFWQMLIEPDQERLEEFRRRFGDERADYASALKEHYARPGAALGWEEHYVSEYATAHPWEDWAETFAHYLHIRDALQTATAFGVSVQWADAEPGTGGRATPAADGTIEEIVAGWIYLAGALNAINRSMGHADAYPFVLSLGVMDKLAFVDSVVVPTAA